MLFASSTITQRCFGSATVSEMEMFQTSLNLLARGTRKFIDLITGSVTVSIMTGVWSSIYSSVRTFNQAGSTIREPTSPQIKKCCF